MKNINVRDRQRFIYNRSLLVSTVVDRASIAIITRIRTALPLTDAGKVTGPAPPITRNMPGRACLSAVQRTWRLSDRARPLTRVACCSAWSEKNQELTNKSRLTRTRYPRRCIRNGNKIMIGGKSCLFLQACQNSVGIRRLYNQTTYDMQMYVICLHVHLNTTPLCP